MASQPLAQSNADSTKIVALDVDGLSTGTTRTLTIQNKSGVLAYSADVPAYKRVSNIATRDSTYPAASQPDGFRVKVNTNRIIYVVASGAYFVESYETMAPSISAWNSMTEVLEGEIVLVDSLRTRYRYNGTSWSQFGCCPVLTESVSASLVDTTSAVSSINSFVANVFTLGSASIAAAPATLTAVTWTWTFSDPGFPNDGRVIIFDASTPANPTSAVVLTSDTGGTPAARVVTGQITGDASSWSVTAGAANDIVLSGGGSITVDLFVQDSAAATDTAADIL